MDISYLGHSSFKLKGRSAALVTDPFNPERVGIKFPKVEADIVTVSHEHEDHNMVSRIEGAKMVIEEPGEYELLGVSIIGIPSFHDDVGGKLRGENTIYVIEMDGLRVAHLGDLGHKLNDKTVDAMGDIDILMIPVGGVYTIGPKIAADIVREFEPGVTIPMHYKVEGLNPEVFSKFSKVDEFLTEVGYDVEKLEKLSIKKELLNEEELKVVVLERKT